MVSLVLMLEGRDVGMRVGMAVGSAGGRDVGIDVGGCDVGWRQWAARSEGWSNELGLDGRG